MPRSSALILTLLLACLFFPNSNSWAAWKAGVAKVQITPEKLMWMSGYGGRDHPAEGKLTDLWAKVLILEDEQGQKAAWITLDLVGIGRASSNNIRSELEKQFGLPRAQVSLFCSHTHTGPVVGRNLMTMYFLDESNTQLVQNYTQQLEQKVVATVGNALKGMKECQVSWGTGRATFAVNRRTNREADVPRLRDLGQLKGPVDHDVPVLAVRNAEGGLQAILCGYACHATVLSFYQWSGDWPGFAQLELEKRHPEAITLFFAGCGADQNPLPRRTVELAQQYGRQMAQAVDDELHGVMRSITGNLSSQYAEIDLPFGELPTREQITQDTESSNRFVASRAKQLLQQVNGPGLPKSYPYPVQTWQLGDGPMWVVLGGEVVVDYAVRIHQELGPNTWAAGYANDVMAYIPSRRVLLEGGYEGGGAMVYYGLPAPWGIDVESLIFKEIHRQAKQLRQPAP